MEKTTTSPTVAAAAQAVWDAWETAPVSLDIVGADRSALAAALRTAAEQIENLYYESDVDSSDGIEFALSQLMLIATELEGV